MSQEDQAMATAADAGQNGADSMDRTGAVASTLPARPSGQLQESKATVKSSVDGPRAGAVVAARKAAAAARGSRGGARQSAVGRGQRKQADARKRALREHKDKINAELKKTARKIMIAGFVDMIVAIAGLALIGNGSGGVKAVLGIILVLISVIIFGILGGIVYRMYASGKEAAARGIQRRKSARARQDLHQFMGKLSAETRDKLMQVDAREKVTTGSAAEAMYLKLNEDELSNALQFLAMTNRDGEFELKFVAVDDVGQLFLGEGTVVYARFGTYNGLEAVARMLKAGAADASFYEGRPSPGRNLDMPISGLLLNASVMGDELT